MYSSFHGLLCLECGFTQLIQLPHIFLVYPLTTKAQADTGKHKSGPVSSLAFTMPCQPVYALLLPSVAKKIGRKTTHAVSLLIGGIGLISFYFAPNKEFLIFSMACVGIAWASILAMPYVILASSIPPGKMGIYMGIFNFFITLPQILNGIVSGPDGEAPVNNQPVYALTLSGVFHALRSCKCNLCL